MKPFLLAAVLGALVLLATFDLTRAGSISLALIVTAMFGALAGAGTSFLFGGSATQRSGLLAISFVIGALFSEAVAFTRYYFSYGYQDPKLSVGVAVSLLEFGALSVVGTIAIFASVWLKNRITGASSRRANARGLS